MHLKIKIHKYIPSSTVHNSYLKPKRIKFLVTKRQIKTFTEKSRIG